VAEGSRMNPPTTSTCLACGLELSLTLERSGSLRCHDCRDADAPLRSELVDEGRPAPKSRRLNRRLRRAA
jgi:hypothetical protein